VNKRLGLGSEVFDGINLHAFNLTILADLIDLDDLATPDALAEDDKLKSKGRRSSKSKPQTTKQLKLTMPFSPKPLDSPASATVSSDGLMTPTEGMSARQLNVLKRKAKLNKSTANKYT